MALQLDAVAASSLNGGSNDNNNVSNGGGGGGGSMFKPNSNHSPSSNDSGFHSDQLQQQQPSRQQRLTSRNRGNIKHKPTYVSVFASDPDYASPLFDDFDRRFASNRPNFLNDSLHLPAQNEEKRSASPVSAPLITPTIHTVSSTPVVYANVSSAHTTHPETSKRFHLSRQQAFTCSHEQEYKRSPPAAPPPALPQHQEIHDATSSDSTAPIPPPRSSYPSSSLEKISVPSERKTHECTLSAGRMETEARGNNTFVDTQKAGSESLNHSPDILYPKIPQHLLTSAESSEKKLYPQIRTDPREAWILLEKSADLPMEKLPHRNSQKPQEEVSQPSAGMMIDVAHISVHSLDQDRFHSTNAESAAAVGPIQQALSVDLSEIPPSRSLTTVKEVPKSELSFFEVVQRSHQDAYGTSLEEPPLQTLSREMELEASQNRPTDVEKFACLTPTTTSMPLKMPKNDTESSNRKSRFVSFEPTTIFERQNVTPKSDLSPNTSGTGMIPIASTQKTIDDVAILTSTKTSYDSSLVSLKKSTEMASSDHPAESFAKKPLNTHTASLKPESVFVKFDSGSGIWETSAIDTTSTRSLSGTLETVSEISYDSFKTAEDTTHTLSPSSPKNRTPSTMPKKSPVGDTSLENRIWSVHEKPAPFVMKSSIPSELGTSTSSVREKPVVSVRFDRTVFGSDDSRTAVEPKTEVVKPMAARRDRNDEKPVPFSKLIEKFAKADNGAIPTPKTFQRTVVASSYSSRTAATTSSRAANSSTSKRTDLNSLYSTKVSFISGGGGGTVLENRSVEKSPPSDDASTDGFSATTNARFSTNENLFTKAKASFEKAAEEISATSTSSSTEKKSTAVLENLTNTETGKFATDVLQRSDKIAEVPSERETFAEECPRVPDWNSYILGHPSVPERKSIAGKHSMVPEGKTSPEEHPIVPEKKLSSRDRSLVPERKLNMDKMVTEERESISVKNLKGEPTMKVHTDRGVERNAERSNDLLGTRKNVEVISFSRKVFENGKTMLDETRTVQRAENDTTKSGLVGGLDFSRFDDITDDDVIGRPLEADEAEQIAIQTANEVASASELRKRSEPSEAELSECKSLLGEKFADYDIFTVILKRSASNPEGSVGVILSSVASGDQYITVQRVISGSIADRSDLIEKGDRVFFVQGQTTKQMSAADARILIKQRTEKVVFVLGRLKTKSNEVELASTRFVPTAAADPDLFNYSTDPEEVELTKGSLGVGLALDGGRASVFGDRPIIVKRIFEGGSAARSGRIRVGDQVTTIDGIDVRGMSYLEATKTLRSRPEGPLKMIILRRL